MAGFARFGGFGLGGDACGIKALSLCQHSFLKLGVCWRGSWLSSICVAMGGARNKSKGTNPKRVKKSVYW